jgi:hypothetical protein
MTKAVVRMTLVDRLAGVIECAANDAIDDFELGCSPAMAQAAARAVVEDLRLMLAPPRVVKIEPRGQPITSEEIDAILGKYYPHE